MLPICQCSTAWFKMRQIDVKTAFLNSTLEDEIFVEQPRGFESGELDVCKINKSIYGLKQASRAWIQFLTKNLLELGYLRRSVDSCLFYHPRKKSFIAVYVDDMITFDVEDISVQERIANLVSGFVLKISAFPNGSWE